MATDPRTSSYVNARASRAITFCGRAHKGTPKAIVDAMFKALDEALKHPDVIERLRQSDQAVVADSPDVSAARLAPDFKTWGAVAKRIGLQAD